MFSSCKCFLSLFSMCLNFGVSTGPNSRGRVCYAFRACLVCSRWKIKCPCERNTCFLVLWEVAAHSSKFSSFCSCFCNVNWFFVLPNCPVAKNSCMRLPFVFSLLASNPTWFFCAPTDVYLRRRAKSAAFRKYSRDTTIAFVFLKHHGKTWKDWYKSASERGHCLLFLYVTNSMPSAHHATAADQQSFLPLLSLVSKLRCPERVRNNNNQDPYLWRE